jgi:hypothetical protein
MRASFRGVYGAATWANVMHFALDEISVFGMSDVNTLVDALAAKYADKLHHDYVNNTSHFTLTQITYRDLADASTYRTARVADYTGGSSGSGAPAQVAYLINWNSGDGRQGGKPRTYICGVDAGAITNDTDLSGGAVSSLSTNANGFLGGVVGLGTANLQIADLVDYSQVNDKAWRVAGHAYEIFNGTCSPFIATIRNRVDRRRG